MDFTTKFGDFRAGEIILIDKPLDLTSFGIVKKVRWHIWNCLDKQYKKVKVGHAGTLDPKATGLVILCTGKFTKRIEEFQAGIKEYYATIKLGATTPSFDLETEEDEQYETSHITSELVKEVIENQFLGEIDQTPPIYSAVKVKGVRAFTYARKGEELELKSRKITIHELDVIRLEGNMLEVRVLCSKGTYIRSLARDIAIALNSGGYLTALRRTRIGDFKVEDALSLEEYEKLFQ
ncbi:tRNA pseudouridine(55) synthase TruB [Prolixibacteraceae bacterium JC049]|nr:tRNA pseudouridine(55) synthase TruB [Prolixibacteraceae bacterium JC049]